MLLLCLVFTSGCKTQGLLKEPPVLVVNCQNITFRAPTGSYTWDHAAGLGYSSCIIADGVHPLALNTLPCHKTNATSVTLNFAVKPDQVRIECWPEKDQGNTDAESTSILPKGLSFSPPEGGYIYQIHASWDRMFYSGSVCYVFYLQTIFDR